MSNPNNQTNPNDISRRTPNVLLGMQDSQIDLYNNLVANSAVGNNPITGELNAMTWAPGSLVRGGGGGGGSRQGNMGTTPSIYTSTSSASSQLPHSVLSASQTTLAHNTGLQPTTNFQGNNAQHHNLTGQTGKASSSSSKTYASKHATIDTTTGATNLMRVNSSSATGTGTAITTFNEQASKSEEVREAVEAASSEDLHGLQRQVFEKACHEMYRRSFESSQAQQTINPPRAVRMTNLEEAFERNYQALQAEQGRALSSLGNSFGASWNQMANPYAAANIYATGSNTSAATDTRHMLSISSLQQLQAQSMAPIRGGLGSLLGNPSNTVSAAAAAAAAPLPPSSVVRNVPLSAPDPTSAIATAAAAAAAAASHRSGIVTNLSSVPLPMSIPMMHSAMTAQPYLAHQQDVQGPIQNFSYSMDRGNRIRRGSDVVGLPSKRVRRRCVDTAVSGSSNDPSPQSVPLPTESSGDSDGRQASNNTTNQRQQSGPLDVPEQSDGKRRVKFQTSAGHMTLEIAANREKYRGVCWNNCNKAWKASIKVKGRNIHIGYYDVSHEAALAYDFKAIQERGASAILNFVHHKDDDPPSQP